MLSSSFRLQYLNSGAGGIAGAFLHDRYAQNPPEHLLGWWSNKQETRFQMAPECDLAVGADSFRLCNPPPWLACLNYASLLVTWKKNTNLISLLMKKCQTDRSSKRPAWNEFWLNNACWPDIWSISFDGISAKDPWPWPLSRRAIRIKGDRNWVSCFRRMWRPHMRN